MIEFQNVSKVYRVGDQVTHALDEVSLGIESGEFVFLVGASGAGKSTLLMTCYHYVLPTSGKVTVADVDLARIRPREVPFLRRNIGVVFQDFRLLPTRTVFENVAFAMRVIQSSYRLIRKRVPEVLDMVGLLGKANSYPAQLSGGEQQRVGLARAVVNHPLLLLADEPTGNLDPETSRILMDLLSDVNLTGTTVVIATHDQSSVDRLRRRVVTLKHGRIVSDRRRGVYAS